MKTFGISHTRWEKDHFYDSIPFNWTCLFFFPDEKDFCQDKIVNSQNKHWLALSPQKVLLERKTEQLFVIMVFGIVTINGDIMSSFIFSHSLRLCTEANVRCLEKVVLPWIKRVTAGRLCLAIRICAMPYKQESPVLVVRKFLQIHHP